MCWSPIRKFANAVIRSARRVYMIGVTVGQTNIFFFDAAGKQIAGFDIAVTRDLNGLRAALKQSLPDSQHQHRRRRRHRRHADGLGRKRGRSATGLRSRLPPGRLRHQCRQRHHGTRPRSGHAEGDGCRGAARRHQAARHRPLRQPQLWRRGGELQHEQPVQRHRPGLERHSRDRQLQKRQRDPARDGARRRDPDPGRAEPDGYLRRDGEFRRRRRISDPEWTIVRHHQVAAGLSGADQLQEIRRQPDVHAGGADGRPHQPESDDRGVRPVVGQRHHPAGARLHPVAHHSRRSAPGAPTPRSNSRRAARSRWPA